MSDSAIPSGGDGAVKPAGNGAPAPAPSVDVNAIVEAVTAKLEAQVANMVTGAVKRNVASAFEGIDLDALKGNGGTPKPADGKKLSPEAVRLADVERRLEVATKEAERNRARALRAGVLETVSKSGVTDEAAELLVDKFAAMVVEDDGGKLHVKNGDSSTPFADYLAEHLKTRKGLLRASAREGSGAGQGNAWAGAMPKSKGEVLYTFGKDAKGRVTRTARHEGLESFLAAHGRAAFDALPD